MTHCRQGEDQQAKDDLLYSKVINFPLKKMFVYSFHERERQSSQKGRRTAVHPQAASIMNTCARCGQGGLRP